MAATMGEERAGGGHWQVCNPDFGAISAAREFDTAEGQFSVAA
jgi:hypothetical protein